MSKKRDRKKITNSNGGDTRQRATSLLNEGAQLLRQQRPAEAVDRLQRTRELNPGSIETLVNLGGAYILQGRHADAVPVLEEASTQRRK